MCKQPLRLAARSSEGGDDVAALALWPGDIRNEQQCGTIGQRDLERVGKRDFC
jgi:hypothetical protein